MDSNEIRETEEHITENFAGQPTKNEFPDEMRVFPRVGEGYQVDIPAIAKEAEFLCQRSSIADSIAGRSLNTPVMWVHSQRHTGNEEKAASLSGFHAAMVSVGPTYHSQELAHEVETLEPLGKEINFPNGSSDSMLHPSCPDISQKYIPLLHLHTSSWSDSESQSFLLGLYIFGKNLVQVRNFVGSKSMGDLLSYYYGKFFGSEKYRRWSECRKVKSRRCIIGMPMFTGWRQQELVARLLAGIPEVAHNALLEIFTSLNVEKSSFEEFVARLKSLVGLDVLVNMVGIGKGKYDLTRLVLDPAKTSHIISMRSDIPIGKACSSLSSGDIIKFLTGDFRLSKARSSDLFWEAVWPRLLAKGWHSEQPKDVTTIGSKHPLVFLIPGIKKFSRRKLVKGDHYFDSLSDVLDKVASDPKILEVDGAEGQSCGSNLDSKNFPDHKRNCYLRPRLSNCNSELMKFTVIDTSLVPGEEPSKVRSLRNLPSDATLKVSPSVPLGDSVGDESTGQSDSHESSTDEHENINQTEMTNISSAKAMADRPQKDDAIPTVSCQKLAARSDTIALVDSDILKSDGRKSTAVVNPSTKIFVGTESSNGALDLIIPSSDVKCKSKQRAQLGQPVYLSLTSKERQLASCSFEETVHENISYSLKVENMAKTKMQSERESVVDKLLPSKHMHMGPSLSAALSNSSSSGSASWSNNQGFCYPPALSKAEKPHINSSIDKGLPHENERSIQNKRSTRKSYPRSLPNSCLQNTISWDFSSASYTTDTMILKTICQSQPSVHISFEQEKPKIFAEEHLRMALPTAHMKASIEEKNQASNVSCAPPQTSHEVHAISLNSRRQSTRSRPPTKKALEALACGFLGGKRKRGDTNIQTSKRSQRLRRENTGGSPSHMLPVSYNYTETSNDTIDDWNRRHTSHATPFNGSHDVSNSNEGPYSPGML